MLVIACPHALGLAVPLVIAISTTLGARNGLLVRNRRGLEEARNLTSVVFDKTGTLTMGEHRVVAVRAAPALEETDALRLAAAVERDSEHPVARAFLATAEERGIAAPAATEFRAEPGRGVTATVEGRRLAVGGPNLLAQGGVALTPELQAFTETAAARGQGVVYLLEARRAVAAFAVADAVRPESREAIRRLDAQGLRAVMLTGDARPVAEAVAQELGIDTVYAEVLPQDKAAKVKELQNAGHRVAMVGDGVNDAPALVTADVGVAIGAGTDVAVEAGDIVLVRSDPRDVSRSVGLSRASYRKMVQNLWWAAGYNVDRDSGGRRRVRVLGARALAGRRRGAHVGEHGDRGAQCAAAAPGESLNDRPAGGADQRARNSAIPPMSISTATMTSSMPISRSIAVRPRSPRS